METIVYQNGPFILGNRDGLAWLEVNGTPLKLTGQPYEPCMYISQADGKITTLRNSFNPSVVLDLFVDGGAVSSITGRVYRPRDFCGLVWHTVTEYGPQAVQIDDAERSYINVLKGLPLRFDSIDIGTARLEKEKTLAAGVAIGELSLDLIRYVYVIRLRAEAGSPVFGQLSKKDYMLLRHYNDITDWDPLEGDISPKKKPLTWGDYIAFASKHPLGGLLRPEDLAKKLVYDRA